MGQAHCSSPYAIEMADIVEHINRVEETWRLVGFVSLLDDAAIRQCGYPKSSVWPAYEAFDRAAAMEGAAFEPQFHSTLWRAHIASA